MAPCIHLIKIARQLVKMRAMKDVMIVPHYENPLDWSSAAYPDTWWCRRCDNKCFMLEVIDLVKKGFDDQSIEMHGWSRMIRRAEIYAKHDKAKEEARSKLQDQGTSKSGLRPI